MDNSKKYSCIIVDDEPPAREILQRYVVQMPMLELSGAYANALQALQALDSRPIDLLFLDIQMPQVSGLELIKALHSPPKIILTTAHEQYALQAFELDVTDYLLKPVRFERFLKAVAKALSFNDARLPGNMEGRAQPANQPFLYFRANRKMVKVFLGDILYIESLKDYVKIFTVGGVVIAKYSMAAMEAMLPGDAFLRVHRSFIAALDKVSSFTADILEIQQYQIPIGRLYRQQVLKTLK